MLKIQNLHASIDNNEILKGVDIKINKGEIHAIMGPNGSGKSTLSSIITGKKDYEITKGNIIFNNQDITDIDADLIAKKGVFLAFQYPIEISGISNINFLRTALNEINKYNNVKEVNSSDFLKLIKEKSKLLEIDFEMLKRSLNEGFSGGEKKRNEIFQMAVLNPKLKILDEIDSGLDIDSLKIVAQGVNKLHNSDTSTLLITHYQRLLDYIKPDFVHVMYDGKIIKSGDQSLAKELEAKGYNWLIN